MKGSSCMPVSFRTDSRIYSLFPHKNPCIALAAVKLSSLNPGKGNAWLCEGAAEPGSRFISKFGIELRPCCETFCENVKAYSHCRVGAYARTRYPRCIYWYQSVRKECSAFSPMGLPVSLSDSLRASLVTGTMLHRGVRKTLGRVRRRIRLKFSRSSRSSSRRVVFS